MAPNLHSKRHTQQAVVDFHQLRVKPEATTSPSAPAAATTAAASYWDWPATAPVVEDVAPVLENNDNDVLSTDHMIANLMRAAARLQNRIVSEPEVATTTTTVSCPSSDDYWAEAQHVDQAEEEEEETAQAVRKHYGPQQDQPSHENYWMEASYDKTSGDDYWNMAAPVAQPHKVNDDKAPRMSAIPENRASSPGRSSSSSSCYWQEKSHELQPSDDYWAESTMTITTATNFNKEVVVAVPTDDYWQWTTDVRTSTDQYWHWPASLPFVCS